MSHNVQFETGVRIGATSTAISTALALNLLIILSLKKTKQNKTKTTTMIYSERSNKLVFQCLYCVFTSSLLIHKDER